MDTPLHEIMSAIAVLIMRVVENFKYVTVMKETLGPKSLGCCIIRWKSRSIINSDVDSSFETMERNFAPRR
jgi:hypothetical protein